MIGFCAVEPLVKGIREKKHPPNQKVEASKKTQYTPKSPTPLDRHGEAYRKYER
jgi:hypothetical protein